MQWLVDLVIAAIGIPPTFIDRGDPVAWDYQKGDFISNDAWHDLDLSAIVPEGAVAVALAVKATHLIAQKTFIFRKGGNVNWTNLAQGITQTADFIYFCDLIVACDADRKIQYYMTTGVWEELYVTVKGWWL